MRLKFVTESNKAESLPLKKNSKGEAQRPPESGGQRD
jgi:hypothetical protein